MDREYCEIPTNYTLFPEVNAIKFYILLVKYVRFVVIISYNHHIYGDSLNLIII